MFHHAVEIDEGGEKEKNHEPNTAPCVEGEEGKAQIVGHFKDNGLDGKDGTGSTVDHHRLTTEETICDALPGGCEEHFDGAHHAVGGILVDGAEGNRGRDGGEEEEDRHANGLEAEVGHLLAPPGADGLLEVLDDASAAAKLLGGVMADEARSVFVLFGLFLVFAGISS
mmetsp:Transcript_32720/g.72154  ORF Transcript_32720/g.72154 Transcript_32720/m.72154 type:complete len:169 (+) Transcript_32720:1560-2066(+)